jgi:hypothetical protein
MYCDEICFLADQKGKGHAQTDVECRVPTTKLKKKIQVKAAK